ncbi:hypothetical protein N7451_010676 [Penicillium sp. IBT 35674x]|nr:hypothetical protein N7451_010676 [Penicillium sp. IBT 35674x]
MVRNLSDVATLPGYVEPPSKLPEAADDEDLEDEIQEPLINDLDNGALVNELMERDLLPSTLNLKPHGLDCAAGNPERLAFKLSTMSAMEPKKAQEGSYRGTQLVLTKVYDLIEQRFMAYTDVTGVEPLLPIAMPKDDRQKYFKFTKIKDDQYPPHLDLGANADWAKTEEKDKNQRSTLTPWDLFNPVYLGQLGLIMKNVGFPHITPGVGTPDKGDTIAEVENYNREQIDKAKNNQGGIVDIFNRPNVGELEDWYTDARFAQQQFTGTNPTTIERAASDPYKAWLDHFVGAAKKSEDASAKETISNLIIKSPDSLYIQDYSKFRQAAGFKDPKCEITVPGSWYPYRYARWGCAAVCLFFLDARGLLHPLAIVTDWRGNSEASVTIYNRELFKRMNLLTGKLKKPNQMEERIDEAHDWPWRYAKTCVQTSDWFQHEVSAHLTRTHLVEEAIIVSANRQLDPNHPVFRILRPHWQKTLGLNAAARTALVPSVILEIVGFKPDEAQKFIQHEYKTFDFVKSYVPTDLRNRGFPPEELDSQKLRNYTYARCVNSMWRKIRAYVENMLSVEFGGCLAKDVDEKVRAKIEDIVQGDDSIKEWCYEMRHPDGADLPSFPLIGNFEELVDCVTMCIHIASPQHTAVNYLQDYYQGFVINKPSCLFAAPPKDLDSLLAYTEKDLVKALPMNHGREWLLSSHVPYLLSFKPDKQKETLKGCIDSALALIEPKDPEKNPKYSVLAEFSKALQQTDDEFQKYNDEKWDAKDIPYSVLKSDYNAVSILI